MMLLDVNLWVYAFRSDSPLHEKSLVFLDSHVRKGFENYYSDSLVTSFLRIVTNEKIFKEPSPIDEAWGFVDWIRSQEGSRMVAFDEMALGVFKHMSIMYKAHGNQIPDLYLASLALRYGLELVTADKGFQAVEGLKVRLLD